MVAFRPDPEKLTAYEELGGGDAKESLLQNPPRVERIRRHLGRKADKGRIILTDEDQDGSRNPRYTPLTDEQRAAKEAGMRVLRSWRNMKEAPDTSGTPEQLVFEGLEYVGPLAEVKAEVEKDWSRRESDITDDTTLLEPTNYQFFKRPDELQK